MKTTKKLDQLPDTLSGLLTVAVRDNIRILKLKKKYRFRGEVWAEKPGGASKPCEVCMFGGILAARAPGVLKELLRERYIEEVVGYDLQKKAEAVDSLRRGWTRMAYDELHSANYEALTQETLEALDSAGFSIARSFDDNRGRAHWRDYLKAAKILKEAGL